MSQASATAIGVQLTDASALSAQAMRELRPCSLDFPTLIMRETDTGRTFVRETTRVLGEKILGQTTFFTYDVRVGWPVLNTLQFVEKTIEVEVILIFKL